MRWSSEEADFYDSHAAGHSRCIYKLIKFKIKKNQCFFSDQNNEKFFKLAQKIADKSKVQTEPECKNRLRVQEVPIEMYTKGKISAEILVCLLAEEKK